jgi:hypothetical protein
LLRRAGRAAFRLVDNRPRQAENGRRRDVIAYSRPDVWPLVVAAHLRELAGAIEEAEERRYEVTDAA